jgi:hypothetical protein
MSPIPSEPLKAKPHEVTMKDGRKVKLKLPGMPPQVKATRTEERGAEEPPREDVRPTHNPLHAPPI